MNVLIGCEYSGTVRDAFIALGHDAMSCDLLPTDKPGPHFQGDVFEAIQMRKWDLAIFHPPCTYLSSSGLHWNKRRPGRQLLTDQAVYFVVALWHCGIPRVCIENPIGCLSTKFMKPSQIIQPWQFGNPESKSTCLWVRGIDKLKPTNILPFPESGRWDNQTASGQNKLGPSHDRWKIRSTTYQGIANAMASQWGKTEIPVSRDTQLTLF